MARCSCVALLVAAAFALSDAFISPQARWIPASLSARQQGHRSLAAARPATRFVPTTKTRTRTARYASPADDVDDDAAGEGTPGSKPAVTEDLDYYSGLLGQQPGADRAAATDGEGSKADYPIPLPSYLLLALATVLSIAFTGSIFEVIGGHPELGYTATYIIGTLSLPSFIFLFYAAIKKGKAEVDEDDAKYGQGRW